MITIPESDWRLLRTLHRTAVDRYCSRVLDECAAVIREPNLSAHDRYLRLFRLINQRDKQIARVFDDLRRSTAFERLAGIISLRVLEDAELLQFSSATLDTVSILAGDIFNRKR